MTAEQRRAWRRRVFAFANADLRHAQKVVLLALETFADFPAGTNARPGITNLAAMCALDERTVRFALKAGERLNLIEQTARANPKRGLAAVYRLLPQPVSTGSADPVDEVSIGSVDPLEPHFNRIEKVFLPDRIDISTGSVDPPTNPYQLNNHRGNGLRQPGTSPGPPERTADHTTDPARRQPANGKPPSWIRGPYGSRCRRHAHLENPPSDCARCYEAAIAAAETA